MDKVAQVVFDLSEGFVFGKVHEAFSYLAKDLLGLGLQLPEEGLDAAFSIIGDIVCGRVVIAQHGYHPGVASMRVVCFRHSHQTSETSLISHPLFPSTPERKPLI
jgi:hypothetical protein